VKTHLFDRRLLDVPARIAAVGNGAGISYCPQERRRSRLVGARQSHADAPELQARAVALIAEKKAAGVAFIVVEQNLAFAERYLIMDQGRAMLEGSRSEIERSHVLAHLHV